MPVLSKSARSRQLRELRNLIESSDNLIVRRVAYSIEQAVRRVTEDVSGWPTLEKQAVEDAELLIRELKVGGE